jgi:spore germination protein GerM
MVNEVEAVAPAAGSRRLDHDRRRRNRWLLLAAAAVVIGLAGRVLVSGDGTDNPLLNWLPWMNRQSVTVYFGDPVTGYLVPVSRTVSSNAEPGEIIESLLEGPDEGTGLVDLMPADTTHVSTSMDGSVLSVDLAGDADAFEDAATRDALLWSLASWPGADVARVRVAGTELGPASLHLVYFYDEARDMMIARPTSRQGPREVLAEFLTGPDEARLAGLPSDVTLLTYDYSRNNGLLSLDFTYLPSVRELAVDHPEAMRRVLESLLATLTTGFPEIEAVWLDFEGHEALGLGQCADLLRTAQTRPEVLNDERLLSRYASP